MGIIRATFNKLTGKETVHASKIMRVVSFVDAEGRQLREYTEIPPDGVAPGETILKGIAHMRPAANRPPFMFEAAFPAGTTIHEAFTIFDKTVAAEGDKLMKQWIADEKAKSILIANQIPKQRQHR